MKKVLRIISVILCAFLISFVVPLGASKKVKAANYDPIIQFQCHIANYGWQPWTENGGIGGTTGQALRLEAIKIQFMPKYQEANLHIKYRAHVSNIGWQPWVEDGQVAGTTGQSLAIEAIQIEIVDDNGNLKNNYNVSYCAHVSNIGWQPWVENGQIAGTTGQALPMEAIEIYASKLW